MKKKTILIITVVWLIGMCTFSILAVQIIRQMYAVQLDVLGPQYTKYSKCCEAVLNYDEVALREDGASAIARGLVIRDILSDQTISADSEAEALLPSANEFVTQLIMWFGKDVNVANAYYFTGKDCENEQLGTGNWKLVYHGITDSEGESNGGPFHGGFALIDLNKLNEDGFYKRVESLASLDDVEYIQVDRYGFKSGICIPLHITILDAEKNVLGGETLYSEADVPADYTILDDDNAYMYISRLTGAELKLPEVTPTLEKARELNRRTEEQIDYAQPTKGYCDDEYYRDLHTGLFTASNTTYAIYDQNDTNHPYVMITSAVIDYKMTVIKILGISLVAWLGVYAFSVLVGTLLAKRRKN